MKDALTSRGAQALARLVALVMLFFAGEVAGAEAMVTDETQALIEQHAEAIAYGAVAIAAALYDVWIHKRETGGVMRRAGERAT